MESQTDVVLQRAMLACPILPSFPARVEAADGTQKLIFALCASCARQQNFVLDSCEHSEDERALEGTYVSEELYAATSKYGYKLVKIYEVWAYNQRSFSLFKDFVNKFLKIKQEASGWPEWCTTLEKKQKYIRNYETNEGIKLDPDKIEYNGPVRDNAK